MNNLILTFINAVEYHKFMNLCLITHAHTYNNNNQQLTSSMLFAWDY